jgi:pSer/pThr/pTyr-binding forkhead associated (FHA) protein/tetratricopeptide (TPR) repeat protein
MPNSRPKLPALRVVEGPETGTALSICKPRIVIGRSLDADLTLSDRRISREHLEICLEPDRTQVRVLSPTNKVTVNRLTLTEARLFHGDTILVSPYSLTFESDRPVDQRAGAVTEAAAPAAENQEADGEAPTIMAWAEPPELVVEDDRGQVQRYPLDKARYAIGRAGASDIRLADPLVSRQHAELTIAPQEIRIRRLSPSRTLWLNGEPVEAARLCDGDRLQIEPYTLRLSSERPVDKRPGDPTPDSSDDAATILQLTDSVSGQTFPLKAGRNRIGRAKEAEVHLDNRYVSRLHAEIVFEDEAYHLRTLSAANPVRVAERTVDRKRLFDGDRIRVDKHVLTFQSSRPQDRSERHEDATLHRGPGDGAEDRTVLRSPDSGAAATVVAGQAPPAALGPRLVVSRQGSDDQTYPLATRTLVAGRAEECDVRLKDPAVSRRHFMVEARDGGFYVRTFAGAPPVLVNREQAEEARLYDGDRIQVGGTIIAFLSDRGKDARLVQHGPSRAVWIAASTVILAALGYLGYVQLLIPWQAGRELDHIEIQLASGEQDQATEALEALLAAEPPSEIATRARALRVQTAVDGGKRLIDAGKVPAAKEHVLIFLNRLGAWREAEPAWRLLDQLHYRLGKELHQQGKGQEAMRELLAVRSQSPLYGKAQQQISQIWHAYQERQVRQAEPQVDNVTALLRKAEENFRHKRFLTPADNNAYAYYRMVLSRDPGNTVALGRVDQIKAFYRERADRFLAEREFQKAVEYYQRYLVIDPSSQEIRRRIVEAKERAPAPAASKAERGDGANTKASQERIRRLLQESGLEADLVLEYLFEEDSGAPADNGEESPW